MRLFSLTLTFFGVALSAFYGAQISPDVVPKQVIAGQLHFQQATAAAAHAEYCKASEALQIDAIDGCGEADRYEAVAKERVHVDAQDDLSPREQQYRDIALLESVDPTLIDPRVHAARAQWITLLKTTLPTLKHQSTLPSVAPAKRLSDWWNTHWLGFGGGLLFMVLGGLLFRRTEAIASNRRYASDNTMQDSSLALLEQLCAQLETLNTRVQSIDVPTFGQLNTTKAALESLQQSLLVPLIDQGPRLQSKHGLTGYASVFSPLSSGERLLNRTWCTLVDQHWPEARRSLNRAVEECIHAHEQLKTLESKER